MFPRILYGTNHTQHKNRQHNWQIEKSIKRDIQIVVLKKATNNTQYKKQDSQSAHQQENSGKVLLGMLLQIKKIKRKNSVQIIERDLNIKTQYLGKNMGVFCAKPTNKKPFECFIVTIITT